MVLRLKRNSPIFRHVSYFEGGGGMSGLTMINTKHVPNCCSPNAAANIRILFEPMSSHVPDPPPAPPLPSSTSAPSFLPHPDFSCQMITHTINTPPHQPLHPPPTKHRGEHVALTLKCDIMCSSSNLHILIHKATNLNPPPKRLSLSLSLEPEHTSM